MLNPFGQQTNGLANGLRIGGLAISDGSSVTILCE